MKKNQKLRPIADISEVNRMHIILLITILNLVVGCRKNKNDHIDPSQKYDHAHNSSEKSDFVVSDNAESDDESDLKLKYQSREKFIKSWLNGAVVLWLDGKSDELNYKSAFDYIDTNIMISGIENWSLLPDAGGNKLKPKIESRDYQLIRILRDIAYSRMHMDDSLAVIREADELGDLPTDQKYEKLKRLRAKYLEQQDKYRPSEIE